MLKEHLQNYIHTNVFITPQYTYQLFDHPVIFIATFRSPCNIQTNFLITL
jgi:hypothetical protein